MTIKNIKIFKNFRFWFVILIFTFYILNFSCFAQEIKEPAVSGLFYPKEASILLAQIDIFLEKAQTKPIPGNIIALISPHAGYDYSGTVAAFGYKIIKHKPIKTVIIIGPSHYAYIKGASVYLEGIFRTPLGDVSIDKELALKIIGKEKEIDFNPYAYRREHSVEVQIPFLQRVLSDFKIVPILMMGDADYSICQTLAEQIFEAIKDTSANRQDREDILIVASTDLCHAYDYNQVCTIDKNTVSLIEKFDPYLLYQANSIGESQLCGLGPVITTMLLAKKMGADNIEILKYANSADITGKKKIGDYCVGYLSAVIYKKGEVNMLNLNQKKRLLEIARKTIEEYVTKGIRLELTEDDPELKKEKGAFVTIHKKDKLRGCIGNIYPTGPLYLTIRDMAISSAIEDPRFPPLSKEELKDIDIEISVLSIPKRIYSIDEIKLGTHGVIVKKGFHSGVFLPQVALETGWTKEEFLSYLCSHKAGLPSDCWKDKNTEIYTFTAEVFSEATKD